MNFDTIIVGGGTAGCVIAARLSEDPKRRVLLLEAGPRDRHPLIGIPGAAAFTLAAPRLNWHRMTEPQSELNGRACYLAQGRVLGGSSSINGMVFTRGAPADYDDWADDGVEGWRFADVLPFFKRCENYASGQAAWRGSEGPLGVQRGAPYLGVVDSFLDGVREIGLPVVEDMNNPASEGVGCYDWTIARGRRCSTARAYLSDAKCRSNLAIRTNAVAERIRIENRRAVGVDYVIGEERLQAAGEEIILAGGAINSPQLLMLSGIGPADHLQSVGVKAVLDLPHVGANLRNHLSYKFSYRCAAPITAYKYLSPFHGAIECAKYAFGRAGFFSKAAAPAGGFFRSSAKATRADMQIFMVPFVLGAPGRGAPSMLPNEHGMTFFINQGRPVSAGTVRLRSANPMDAPAIDPRYLTDRRDLETLIDGAQTLLPLRDTAAFKKIGAERIEKEQGGDRAVLEAAIRATADNHYHVSGSCRMGADERQSVVDSRLRVHGIAGLRVADASIMPRLVNANLSAPVIMIAERAADFILTEN